MRNNGENGERERVEGLKCILPYLPQSLVWDSDSESLTWSATIQEALEAISRGPDQSRIFSGEVLALSISDMSSSSSLSLLAPFAAKGYAFFFDELMVPEDSDRWFKRTLPCMASNLMLRLPFLLLHSNSSLSLLDRQQQSGIVFLHRHLIAALLSCSFFSLFPVSPRYSNRLPPLINFDHLFASLYETYTEHQHHKIKCLMHYFDRVCSSLPQGYLSFERKVLPLPTPTHVSWAHSSSPLSPLQIHSTGRIEDHPGEALHVDFANAYIGGGALSRGCVQEEILFMIKPELIISMLFLPAMEDNEAIEIIGAERFSNYTGYASSFRFKGNYVDGKGVDGKGRRRSSIVAIDALCNPGRRQYKVQLLLRETNKAYCGFQAKTSCRVLGSDNIPRNEIWVNAPVTDLKLERKTEVEEVRNSVTTTMIVDDEEIVGIVTGNWGCGAFGGDPQLKCMIQWLAASQASRPSISYYTFGLEALHNLHQVSQWILSHKWTVGDLWNMLTEYSSYSSQRVREETRLGFFAWLLPSLTADDPMMLDKHDTF